MKKLFKSYYLLACEGHTEYILFSYLTRNRFRNYFSSVIFKEVNLLRNKIEVIMGGKLNGVGDWSNFNSKYSILKEEFSDGKFFFFLDNDLDDSQKIGQAIRNGGDVVQFVKYNSEYLLLELYGHPLKCLGDFENQKAFRDYCKEEFLKVYNKEAKTMNDRDLDLIFRNISDGDIVNIFSDLFSCVSH
jgi:hypothetical protein